MRRAGNMPTWGLEAVCRLVWFVREALGTGEVVQDLIGKEFQVKRFLTMQSFTQHDLHQQ